jgi:hypothetical protein
MKKQTVTILGLLILLISACTPAMTLPKEDQLATIIAKTLTAQPTNTSITTPTAKAPVQITETLGTPTVTIPAVATDNGSVFVRTVAQNVNLRTNPGTLFPVSRVMPEGTRLQVLGLSPGQEWVLVLNEEGINGWVRLPLLEKFPTGGFPKLEPGNVLKITGRVMDENGLPVSGIGYAIEGQSGSKSLRTDAVTDDKGTFYAYLPQSVAGTWIVSLNSVSCTSNTMDADCNCLNNYCGTSYPLSQSVNPPFNEPLTFIWK